MNEESEKLFQRLIKHMQEENEKQTEIIKSGFKAEISGIKAEIAEIKTIIKEAATKTKVFEEKIKIIENKYTLLEKAIRKNNIVIFGLDDKNKNLIKYTIDQINQYLELNLSIHNINNIYAIGKPHLAKRPILLQFT